MPCQLFAEITLHRIRRKTQDAQEPGRSEDINFPPELLKLNNESEFLLLDDFSVSQKTILIFSSSKGIKHYLRMGHFKAAVVYNPW